MGQRHGGFENLNIKPSMLRLSGRHCFKRTLSDTRRKRPLKEHDFVDQIIMTISGGKIPLVKRFFLKKSDGSLR